MNKKMNEIVNKAIKEIARILLAALLAALGLESVGCVACGDSATASLYSEIGNK